MRRSVFVCVCFFIFCSAFAQQVSDFKGLVKQTNAYFSVYEQLSPYGEAYFALNALGLTKAEIQQEIIANDSDNVLSPNKDSIMEYIAILSMQDRIASNIKKIIAHPDFKKYDIRTLLTSKELSIVKSEDGKLYNFSFDAKNGGTYRMQVSIMHYTDYNVNQTGNINTSEKFGSDFYFSDDGYTAIHSISSSEGTKYVLIGSVKTCSMCFGSYVTLIRFKDNAFVQDFHYSIDLRDYESGVEYNPETKTISVNYRTDDLTPDCTCGDEDGNEEESNTVTEADEPGEGYSGGVVDEVVLETEQEVIDEEAEPVIRQCSCTFVFDGKTFQLKRKESLIVNTEDE